MIVRLTEEEYRLYTEFQNNSGSSGPKQER